MREPKFKKGQFVILTSYGKEVFIQSVNFKRYTVVKNGMTTGVEETFTGSYYCSWLNDKGKTVSDNIDEDLLTKPN
jgi:hypothetical protein